MSFIITGQATDLDLDTANLPTVTAQVLAPWTAEDGTLRTSHATGRFDETGALVKDDGGAWVIGAPEAAPMYVKASGLPSLRFPAPADGTTVDLADLYADNSPQPAPSPTTSYVRGASAYEVAVANGFVGTEAEWLATLGDTTFTVVRQVSDLLVNGWAAIAVPSWGVYLSRDGNSVTFTGYLNWTAATAAALFTLPAGFRPSHRAYGTLSVASPAGLSTSIMAVPGSSAIEAPYALTASFSAGFATITFRTTDAAPTEPYPGIAA